MSTEVETKSTEDIKPPTEEESKEAPVEATKLLAQGKRNLVCGEIPTAVNQLQEACGLLAVTFGETAKECGESYFYYGQALLELARMETGVLGNALQGVPEEDTEDDAEPSEQFERAEQVTGEEREKLRDEVNDAMSEADPIKAKEEVNGEAKVDKAEDAMETEENKENVKENEEVKETVEEEGDKDEEGEKAEEGDEDEEEGTADEEEGEGTAEEGEVDPGEGTSKGEKEEDPEDISNFQLSWEMLELAKIIYLRQEEKEMKLKAAQAYLKLGEVSLETEQYEQAITDIGECFKIQKELLEEDDRLLAETQYQLGLAYSFDKKFDDAIDSFRGAIKVIEEKMGKLEKIIEDGKTAEKTEQKPEGEKKEKTEESKDEAKEDSNGADDPVKAAQKEINDLKEILPDIRTKIDDVVEERKNMDVAKEMAKDVFTSQMKPEEAGIGTQPCSSESGAKPTDITHLIRKKRKPESDTEEEAEAKKSRQEDGSGDAKVVTNGVHDTDKAKEVKDVEMKDAPVATEDKAEAVST